MYAAINKLIPCPVLLYKLSLEISSGSNKIKKLIDVVKTICLNRFDLISPPVKARIDRFVSTDKKINQIKPNNLESTLKYSRYMLIIKKVAPIKNRIFFKFFKSNFQVFFKL